MPKRPRISADITYNEWQTLQRLHPYQRTQLFALFIRKLCKLLLAIDPKRQNTLIGALLSGDFEILDILKEDLDGDSTRPQMSNTSSS